jgi:hypothetical protein
MNHARSKHADADPDQGDGTPAIYGIAVRVAFAPDRWEALGGFRTSDTEWARALADRIGRGIARPVRLRVARRRPLLSGRRRLNGCPERLAEQDSSETSRVLSPPPTRTPRRCGQHRAHTDRTP